MRSDEFVCTYECPTLYDQIQNWVKQITEQQKKTDTTKPRLKDMKYLELSRYVKDNYNMSWDQMYIVWIDIKQHVLNDDNIDYVINNIRYGMSREERFGCTPTWTEDMIRFIRDFWNQIPELEFELIHISIISHFNKRQRRYNKWEHSSCSAH